ncbi:hypothetical protein [Mechercharimyces sp. CAU 1602]|uniref:hypothetical protein n=1 Tax=Mechercharimyces sp. CAU 1602 TaxID=2973933 RepID=UPI002161D515|nr:hypothetical protein [Mechercharimyces sp. CAU 1602]MCS1351437.1 hypothetical protein [Mechercharimyces sp. CAU 1602]
MAQPRVTVGTKKKREQKERERRPIQTPSPKIVKRIDNDKRDVKKSPSSVSKQKKPPFPLVYQQQTEEADSVEWGGPRHSLSYPKKQAVTQRPFVTLLLAVVSAILLGVVLGYSILVLFFTDSSSSSSQSIDAHLQNEPKNITTDKKEAGGAMASLPTFQVTLLQAGSFNEVAGAQEKVEDYRSRGRAAVMTDQKPYRIYLGVSVKRDDALKLSAYYQKDEVDVYLKDLSLKGSATKELTQKVEPVLLTGIELFTMLEEVTVAGMGGREEAVASKLAEEKLQKGYQSLIQQQEDTLKALNEEQTEYMKTMTQALDQAVQSAFVLKKSPSEAILWQMQEGLLRYAIAYNQFVSSVK